MSEVPDEIWDGNGGTFKAKDMTQRDMLVLLHYKVDALAKDVGEQDGRLRTAENWIITQQTEGAIWGRLKDAAWLAAVAVIGSLVYVVGNGGFH